MPIQEILANGEIYKNKTILGVIAERKGTVVRNESVREIFWNRIFKVQVAEKIFQDILKSEKDIFLGKWNETIN